MLQHEQQSPATLLIQEKCFRATLGGRGGTYEPVL